MRLRIFAVFLMSLVFGDDLVDLPEEEINLPEEEEEEISTDYGLGWIDRTTFITEIVPEYNTTVLNNNTWFVYLFHSFCQTKRCMKLNEAYESIYNEWQDVQNLREREGDSVDHIQIGRVNCRQFKLDICERILLSTQKMPKFLILHNDTSYEFRGTLQYSDIEKQI